MVYDTTVAVVVWVVAVQLLWVVSRCVAVRVVPQSDGNARHEVAVLCVGQNGYLLQAFREGFGRFHEVHCIRQRLRHRRLSVIGE